MWRYATVRRIRQAETSVLISTAVPALVSMPLLLLVLLMELLVRLLLALIVLLLALLLLRVCLMLIGRALLTLLTLLLVFLLLALIFLLLVLLFLLMRRLLLLKVPLLLLARRLALLVLLLVLLLLPMRRLLLLKVPLLLLLHRLLLIALLVLLISLLCRLVCPISVLAQPIGMIGRHPIWILLVPPLAIMPNVPLVVVAITVAPAWVERDPIRVVVVKPVGIVLMPPIGVAPLMLVIVVTPLGFGRSRGPVFIVQGLPYVRMGPEVLLQLGILPAPIGVVEQPGIPRECPRNVRVVCEEIAEALVSLILRHIVEPRIVIREAGYLRPSNLNRDLRRGWGGDCEREQNRAQPHNRSDLTCY